MAQLEESDDFFTADIYITLPSGNITDEDSGDEEDVTVNHLSGCQLAAEAVATKRVGGERVEMTANVDEFSDEEGTTDNGKPDIVEMNG